MYLGKVIHETSYERERKEIEIDQIKLDFLDIRDGVLHEVKKSDKWSEAHEWQVLDDIQRIIDQQTPPDINVKKSYCRSCSYFELCYV